MKDILTQLFIETWSQYKGWILAIECREQGRYLRIVDFSPDEI